jgi:hypothetical protein
MPKTATIPVMNYAVKTTRLKPETPDVQELYDLLDEGLEQVARGETEPLDTVLVALHAEFSY